MSKQHTSEQVRAATEELARRALAKSAAGGVIAGLREELFDKQLAVWDDPARLKAALCTRRAGKTELWSRYATAVALQTPRALIRIWAQTRLRVKQLLLVSIKLLCARHKIPVQVHETELTIRFENGSEIRLVGADRDQSAQRKRGDATHLEVVLEAQSWGPFLTSLINDVCVPSVFDHRGVICLEGTPGPLPTGYWYFITGEVDDRDDWLSEGIVVDGELAGAGWSCHRWSLLDNPMMPRWRGRPDWREEAKRAVKEEREAKHWGETHPSYVREFTGHWVRDDSALYYAYNPKINQFKLADKQPWGPGWSHCLGLDIGWRDATAIVVWGWHENDPHLYEAFSWSESEVLSDDVVKQIQSLNTRGLNIVKMVADVGGGGRRFIEDIQQRFGITFEDAAKTKKYENVGVYNDHLRSGLIKIQEGSKLEEQIRGLPRDPEWDPLSGKPPGEDPRFKNDACDASLYSLRACFNYAFERVLPPLPPKGSKEWVDAEEAKMLESLETKETQAGDEWWETDYNGEEDL